MAAGSFPPFFGATTPGPLAAYLAQVPSAQRGSTNFLSWLAVNLQFFQDGIACMATFPVAFGLLTAVGAQLDILGRILGQSRTIGFQPRFGISPTLDDTTYRLLLQSKVWQNHWDGTTPGLFQGWYQIFPQSSLVYIDNQNMTVDITVGLSASTIVQDLITNDYFIPRPQGVRYTITLQAGGWNVNEWGSAPWNPINPS